MPGMSEAASELESIARHLRRAGQLDLVKSLQKAIADAARPVADDVRAGLADHLPNRYAETLGGDIQVGVATRTTGSEPGVRLYARPGVKARKLRTLDAGILHHPVYGNREAWVTQTAGMVKGFFTGPCEKAAPRVRAAVVRALDDVAARAVAKEP